MLKFFGFPNDSQQATIQIAIISENKLEIFGEVINYLFPKEFEMYNIRFFDHKEHL